MGGRRFGADRQDEEGGLVWVLGTWAGCFFSRKTGIMPAALGVLHSAFSLT